MTNEDRYLEEARELHERISDCVREQCSDSMVYAQDNFDEVMHSAIAAWLKKRDEERDLLIAANVCEALRPSFVDGKDIWTWAEADAVIRDQAKEYRKQADTLRTEADHA